MPAKSLLLRPGSPGCPLAHIRRLATRPSAIEEESEPAVDAVDSQKTVDGGSLTSLNPDVAMTIGSTCTSHQKLNTTDAVVQCGSTDTRPTDRHELVGTVLFLRMQDQCSEGSLLPQAEQKSLGDIRSP